MKSLCGEPISMWLPEKYKKPNTSTYVQGVEVETDYMGMIRRGSIPFICRRRNI